jgi:hypothetical protein
LPSRVFPANVLNNSSTGFIKVVSRLLLNFTIALFFILLMIPESWESAYE